MLPLRARAVWAVVILPLLITAVRARDPVPTLPFSRDLEAATRESRASGKPLAIVFVAAWCPVCREMEQGAFVDPAVLELAGGFVWARVDIDRNLSVAREMSVSGVPLILFRNSSGRPIAALRGGLAATEFHGYLARVLEMLDRPGAAPLAVTDPGQADHGQSTLTWKPGGYRGSGICFSHVGYGPLRIPSQSPFQSLRLQLRPGTPSTIGRGQYDFSATTTWVNVWSVDGGVQAPDRYHLDFEALQNSIALAYGISDTVEIEGSIGSSRRFGGLMDGFIQGFHDLTGIAQNGRDEVPDGSFSIRLDPGDGPPVVLDNDDRGNFSRALQFTVQHNVSCGRAKRPALSYSVTARWDTADERSGSGGSGLDVGVSVSLARRVRSFYFYGTLGVAWFGSDNFYGIPLDDTQLSALLAAEWKVRPRQSIVAQYLLTEGVVEDFGPFSKLVNEVVLGFKWEVRPGGILELGVIENVLTPENSPDFGLHVGWSRRF